MMRKEDIDANKLPLDVREHLMRGQQDNAIIVLENHYDFSKIEAEQLIEDYRQNLRDRKVALDIQIMNEKNAKEARDQQYFYWRWGVRGALFIGVLVLLYQIAGSIK